MKSGRLGPSSLLQALCNALKPGFFGCGEWAMNWRLGGRQWPMVFGVAPVMQRVVRTLVTATSESALTIAPGTHQVLTQAPTGYPAV
jgi:hypothetical protein